jgi:hypothetical protein
MARCKCYAHSLWRRCRRVGCLLAPRVSHRVDATGSCDAGIPVPDCCTCSMGRHGHRAALGTRLFAGSCWPWGLLKNVVQRFFRRPSRTSRDAAESASLVRNMLASTSPMYADGRYGGSPLTGRRRKLVRAWRGAVPLPVGASRYPPIGPCLALSSAPFCTCGITGHWPDVLNGDLRKRVRRPPSAAGT